MQSDGPLRVLLVSSDADVLDSMRRALATGDFSLAGDAWPGIEAVHRAAELQPDVVMMHIEPPLGPATRTVQGVATAAPAAGVAVLSSLGDLDTVRRVMNAGAHDFATLPLSDGGLRDAARRAHEAAARRISLVEQAPPPVTGTVITVAGPRGGVGKTTLATNLGIALAQETGTSVVVADLDVLFGAAAIALGVMPGTTLQEWLIARAAGHVTPASRYLAEHRSGAKLLAAPLEPDPDLVFNAEEVAALIGDLASTHEFVVVDTGASFTETTAAAIELSSVTLLLTSSDLASMRATRYVVKTLRNWQIDDERLRLVQNSPVAISPGDVSELSEAIGLPVSWVLPHDREVLKTTDLGSPVCESRPNSPLAREVRNIARYFGRVQTRPKRKLLGVL
jgi:pilus assembly protein CpaE